MGQLISLYVQSQQLGIIMDNLVRKENMICVLVIQMLKIECLMGRRSSNHLEEYDNFTILQHFINKVLLDSIMYGLNIDLVYF